MGNKDFNSKMDFLCKSKHLRIKSFLDNISKWDMSDIDARTETLTDKMLDLFPYPKK